MGKLQWERPINILEKYFEAWTKTMEIEDEDLGPVKYGGGEGDHGRRERTSILGYGQLSDFRSWMVVTLWLS